MQQCCNLLSVSLYALLRVLADGMHINQSARLHTLQVDSTTCNPTHAWSYPWFLMHELPSLVAAVQLQLAID